jgi:hypothetical protein
LELAKRRYKTSMFNMLTWIIEIKLRKHPNGFEIRQKSN